MYEEVEEVITNMYYEVIDIYNMCKRAVVWGYRLRNSYPWNSGALLEMEVMKLKELLDFFENHGYHDPECETYKPKMKSLRLAIKLGDLLLNDEYTKYYDLYIKTWGETHCEFEEIVAGRFKGNYRLIRLRDGKVWEPCEKEKAELDEAWKKDARRQQKHRRWFYGIIAQHGERWWD